MRVVLPALLLLGGTAVAAENAPDPCYAFTPDAEYVETTVIRQHEGGEVTLSVPKQYFEDFWDRRGGYRDTAQLIRVEIGSWEPVTREETGERNRQGIWNWMHFVVGDVISLEVVVLTAADLFGPDDATVSDYPPRPGPEGLAWLDTPYASDKERPDKDVFVDPAPPAPLTTVIECSSPLDPVSRHPTCTQFFRAGGLDAQLVYRRSELRRWREFQAQVTAFLTCATSEAS